MALSLCSLLVPKLHDGLVGLKPTRELDETQNKEGLSVCIMASHEYRLIDVATQCLDQTPLCVVQSISLCIGSKTDSGQQNAILACSLVTRIYMNKMVS